MSIPTLCSWTLSCCQMGFSASGTSGRRPAHRRRGRGRHRRPGHVVGVPRPEAAGDPRAPPRTRRPSPGEALFRQRLAEGLAHDRRLVGVVDLVAADPPADPGLRDALRVADRDDLVLEGEVARRGVAGVEVLVEPHVRRNDQRSGLPVVAPRLLALGPHQAEALPAQHDHVGAGAVPVPLLVRRRPGTARCDCSSSPLAIMKRIWPPPAPRSLALISGRLTASATKLVLSSRPFCSSRAAK